MIPDAYKELLAKHGAGVFSPSELVVFSGEAQRRKALPPPHLRENILRALDLAVALRAAMLPRGASGLLVRAAYRPHGGAPNSAHKRNRALDLDLLVADVRRVGDDLRLAFAEEATRLWCARGIADAMGLGLYGARGSERTWRVHVDTAGCRTWQHAGSAKVRSAAWAIADRLGLDAPTRSPTLIGP